MELQEFLTKIEMAKHDPDVCSLPDDDESREAEFPLLGFSKVKLSLAIVEMMCTVPSGKHGYVAQLCAAPNLEARVARDALNMLRGSCDQSAWEKVRDAFPSYWLERDAGSSRIVWPPERAHSDAEWQQHLIDVARADDEAQSPFA